jgi:hypothetical protein
VTNEDSELFRRLLVEYGKTTASALRSFGIEATPEEAESIVRESLMEAVREFWKRRWLRRLENPNAEES